MSNLRGPRSAKELTNLVTVHLLKHGLPRCRFSTEVPANWPGKGHHSWVSSLKELMEELPSNAEACDSCLHIEGNEQLKFSKNTV